MMISFNPLLPKCPAEMERLNEKSNDYDYDYFQDLDYDYDYD